MDKYKTWRKLSTPEIWLFVPVLLCGCVGEAPSPEKTVQRENTANQWLESLLQSNELVTSDLPRSNLNFDSLLSANTARITVNSVFSLSSSDSNQASGQELGALLATIDRVSLRSDVTPPETGSAWNYQQVLRSNVITDASSNATVLKPLSLTDSTSSIQRAALNLSGATVDKFWVLDTSVSVEPQVALSGDKTKQAPPECSARYLWLSPVSDKLTLQLEFDVSECPETNGVGDYSIWDFAGIVATGSLIEQHNEQLVKAIPLKATVWMTQSWGIPPSLGGAVVLDSVSIALDNGLLLNASRSKRISGTGPKTVTADLSERDASGRLTRLRKIDLQWQDIETEPLANASSYFPQSIALNADAADIDLELKVLNRMLENNSMIGNSLNVPVVVSGSHSGTGFLNYSVLDNSHASSN